jgi:hypothetical protein
MRRITVKNKSIIDNKQELANQCLIPLPYSHGELNFPVREEASITLSLNMFLLLKTH